MIATGTILVDLTKVKESSQRNRVHAALADAPNGAAVELIVGPLIVGDPAVRMLREIAEQRDLTVHVKGEVRSVGPWLTAIRTGEVCGGLLL